MKSIYKLKKVFDDYARVLMIPEFEDECEEILSNKGQTARYYRSLRNKCRYLNEHIDDVGSRFRKEYLEPMKGKEAAGFAKIPISGKKKNYRIILCFLNIDGVEHAVFLHIFMEKRAHKDYRQAIKMARKRYNRSINEER